MERRSFLSTFSIVGIATLGTLMCGCIEAEAPQQGDIERQIENQFVPRLKLKHPGEIRVMVIDTGINPHSYLKKIVQYQPTDDYQDNHGHGTNVAGIVAFGNNIRKTGLDTVCRQVKIYSCRFYDPKAIQADNLQDSIKCVKRALAEGMDVINYSGGGVDYSTEEYRAYKAFIKSGGIAVTSAGNEYSNSEESPYYPADYADRMHLRGLYFVENIQRDGRLAKSSNYNRYAMKEYGETVYSTKYVNDGWDSMTGTSQASAAYAHRVLKKACLDNWGIK